MSGIVATRRHLLALALSTPVFAALAAAPASGADAQRRIGEELLLQKGLPACLALVRSSADRLRQISNSSSRYEYALADDFRARRTVAVDGILLSETEAAICLHAVIGRHAI